MHIVLKQLQLILIFFVFSVRLQRANDDKKVVSEPTCGRAGQ